MFSDDFKRGSSSFIKLDDGGKVVGVFAGAPLEYKNNFKLKQKYPMGLESYPDGTSTRFKINFLVGREGKFFPFVFESSKGTALTLEAVTKKYGVDYIYEITRNGSGKKTVYSIMPERALTPEEKSAISKIKLAELTIGQTAEDSED